MSKYVNGRLPHLDPISREWISGEKTAQKPGRRSCQPGDMHLVPKICGKGSEHVVEVICEFSRQPYRGVLKTRWHARVQGGFEGYVRDIWRTFGGVRGYPETT